MLLMGCVWCILHKSLLLCDLIITTKSFAITNTHTLVNRIVKLFRNFSCYIFFLKKITRLWTFADHRKNQPHNYHHQHNQQQSKETTTRKASCNDPTFDIFSISHQVIWASSYKQPTLMARHISRQSLRNPFFFSHSCFHLVFDENIIS